MKPGQQPAKPRSARLWWARTVKVLLTLAVAFLAALWLLPIVTAFLAAFKFEADFVRQKFYDLPTQFGLISNLQSALIEYRILENVISSLLYAVVGTAVAVVLSSAAAYSIVRMRPRFSFSLFLIIYSGTLFPFQMYLIPLFRAYNVLGLYDTWLGMSLLYSAICIPFALFAFRGFYTTVPREVEEAAKLDGCGPTRMLFSIFVPNSAAPTAVVALFQATWIWNDLLFGMVLSRSPEVRPIMVAVSAMMGFGGNSIPRLMAVVICVSIPTVLLFLFLRKYFIQGMVLSRTEV